MTFIQAIKTCFQKYVDFDGRASRSEFWYFFLFCVLGSVIFDILSLEGLWMLFSLAVLLPSLAVMVRRLHDINKSGKYLLVALIPVIGAIWLLILCASAPENVANEYGAASNSDASESNTLDNNLDQLEKLYKLYESGAISKEVYEEKKSKISL